MKNRLRQTIAQIRRRYGQRAIGWGEQGLKKVNTLIKQ